MATAELVRKTELVEKVEERIKTYMSLDNKLTVDAFGWIHLPCDAVVAEKTIQNSPENDPSSGDPLPVFGIKLHCNLHNVSSLIEEK